MSTITRSTVAQAGPDRLMEWTDRLLFANSITEVLTPWSASWGGTSRFCI